MKNVLYLFLFSFPLLVKAQSRDSIFFLKKEKVIRAAEAYLQKDYPKFNPQNFDTIFLSKSNRNRYKLSFGYYLKYIPIGKSFNYNATCIFTLIPTDSLPVITISESSVDAEDPTNSFYKSSKKDSIATQFVLKALNYQEFYWDPNMGITIKELKNEYEVLTVDKTNGMDYHKFINKTNGNVRDDGVDKRPYWDGDVAPKPEGGEKWEEMNW